MGDRRIFLGSGVVLVGLGSALIAGAAVAAADAADGEGAAAPAANTSGPSAGPHRGGVTRPAPDATPAARSAARAARPPAAAAVTTRTGAPASLSALAAPVPVTRLGSRAGAKPAATVAPTSAAPPDPAVALPGLPASGVTGVQTGRSRLTMPGAFIGDSVPADWYFPTQADGTVQAKGVIWLQHGFAASNTLYSALAENLASTTNSIVVAPTLSSIPLTFSGGWLNGAASQQAAARIMLTPDRPALVSSALAAGYPGDIDQLKGRFAMAGHSAGGGFASAVGADYVTEGTDTQDVSLAGVVMFDGVSAGTADNTFASQVKSLVAANKPVYQIAAPAQIWNAFGATTNQLLAANPGAFDGVVLAGGSHVDSVLGVNPIIDGVLQLVVGRAPAGNTAATYTLSTGWINDFFTGASPEEPKYGLYAPADRQMLLGPATAVALPSPVLNQVGPLGGLMRLIGDTVGALLGRPSTPQVNTGDNGVTDLVRPPGTNGVTGVRTGTATLTIPSGNGYNAPADWYFPTRADGSVQANGIIWLQHGFLGFKQWYSGLAERLARDTNSIVVVPQIFWFDPAFSGDAAAAMFLGDRDALQTSATAAGYQGALPAKFILTGHSAGGGFATTAGAGTVDNGAATDLLGVVMFDGVEGAEQFAAALAKLSSLGIPDYQIAAPPQSWNAWGATTEQLAQLQPDRFVGTLIDNGSHTDSVAGDSLWARLGAIGSALFVKPSPPGGKAAVGTFATGWINDLYSGPGGYGPGNPGFGVYGRPNDGAYRPGRIIVMGQATARPLPAPVPVDLARYAGTWYEQGSVKQFFSLGLVNTKAVYTPLADGSIKVENSGNYFGPNGPASTITGSAVVVNSPTNTRLAVGFSGGRPSPKEPGNYWIVDYDPDYRWVIVSDSSGRSGYVLTRDQTVSPERYRALVARAVQLGVTGRITPTRQFPPSSMTV